MSKPTSLPSGVEVRPARDGETVYRVRLRRQGRQATGTFATLAEALAYRAAALTALRDGSDLPAAPERAPAPEPRPTTAGPTVHEAALSLVAGMVGGTVRNRRGYPHKPSVVRKYEAMLRVHVLPAIGALPLAGLARRDIQRFVDELAARTSAETARKALTALRVALRVAQRDGHLDTDPCVGVRVPEDSEGEAPIRLMTPEEATAIVAAADAHDARLGRSLGGPLFALAFGSGLRSGESLALVWGPDGLDLDAGVVRVRRSLDRDRGPDGRFAITVPKSRAGRRDVPLDPADVARLRRHRLATGRPPDGALVFADAKGEPLGAKGIVRYTWEKSVKAAEIAEPLPRFHDTRHAWATAMLAAGLTAHGVAKLGGWSDVSMVLRRYGHALPDEVAGAGQALARFRAARSAVG